MFNRVLKRKLIKKNEEIESLKDQLSDAIAETREYSRSQQNKLDEFEDACEERIRQVNLDAEKLIEKSNSESKKAIRAEYDKEITALKKENKEMFEKLMEVEGKYDGSIGIIKNLENQLASTKDFSSKLIEKLPSVSANIKSADNNVNILK